jgi:hypothetical protein
MKAKFPISETSPNPQLKLALMGKREWMPNCCLSLFFLKKVLKPIPDFADEVNDIIWRLENLFFVKKKPYVNPGMTEAVST